MTLRSRPAHLRRKASNVAALVRVLGVIALAAALRAPAIEFKTASYLDTAVPDPLVKENGFLHAAPNLASPPTFAAARAELPQPEWPARPDVIACYWKAWELGFGNLRAVTPANGFVSPYIEPAFNEHIFMWDSCFMLMFGRYAERAFHFQGTLDNFYAKQHADGFICREIRESDGGDCFERFDPSSTGPDILPWAEWEYFLNFGDRDRLARVFPPLLAYYHWFETYRAWPDGTYFSSGWGCGMDNQPRVPAGFDPGQSPAFMSWIDTTLQQIFAGRILVQMGHGLGRDAEVTAIERECRRLAEYVNRYMWDDHAGFYVDRFRDGSRSHVKSIAGYWALLADVVPPNRIDRFVAHLDNPAEFKREHRVATLSADDPQFDPNGGYWRGSVWAPTNYMVLRGLTLAGRDELAYEIARNHLDNVVGVYSRTGTLFENYAPDKLQGNDHKDFVGWTGLAPITVLFEYVFGLRPDLPAQRIVWDVRLTDEFGVKQYPIGRAGLAEFHCAARGSVRDKPVVTIQSTVPLTVELRWAGGRDVVSVPAAPR